MNTQAPTYTVPADFNFAVSMAGHAARVCYTRLSEAFYAALEAPVSEQEATQPSNVVSFGFTDSQARAFISTYPLTEAEDNEFEGQYRTEGFPPFGYSATQVRAKDLFRYLRTKANKAVKEEGSTMASYFAGRELARMVG